MSLSTLQTLFMEPRNVAYLALGVTFLAVVRQRLGRSSLPLPPGPPSSFFGTGYPKSFPYLQFEKWAQEYGPVFSVRRGFSTVIVIARLRAAEDILEKEGAVTADRPRSIAAGETLSGGLRLIFTSAGERFKIMRKAVHAHLQPKYVSNYTEVLMRSAKQQVLDIIENPEQHQNHAIRFASSVLLAMIYAKNPKEFNDPELKAVRQTLTKLVETFKPGVWKVELFPFLRYVPGYLKELQTAHAKELALYKAQMDSVRHKTDHGEGLPRSLAEYLLEHEKDLGLTEGEAAYLAGGMFGAGADIAGSAVSVSTLAAACYPEAQQRVWEELEAVVGKGRAPHMSDQDNLPQTMAFVFESLRWRPITAGGFPHRAMKDVVWNGYLIPKGSTVLGTIWSIGRDPDYFPDPNNFNPQRWIKDDGTLNKDLWAYSFGFGRRSCPAQQMGVASVFISTALLMWSFRMEQDPDSLIDQHAFTEGNNTHPMPFKVVFEPRFMTNMDGVKEMLEEYVV